MFLFSKLFKFIFVSILGSLIKNLFIVSCAIFFMQFPNIVDRYINLIRGAKYETVKLQEILGELRLENLDSQVIKKTWENLKPSDDKRKGEFQSSISILKLREIKYQKIGVSLEESPMLLKPFYFVWSLFSLPEFSLLKELQFELSILLNLDTIFYGILGMLFGILITALFRKTLGLLF